MHLDDQRFAEVFRQHEKKLYSLVWRMTKSDQYAKDIVQDVFLKLWEQRDRIDEIRNIEAWLYRLTENRVIDFLRKVAADERLRDAVWKRIPQQQQHAEELLEAKEFNSIIRNAINSLPPQRKLIYQLNRDKGMSYQEIADSLSISRHTVKNQLSMALQSIQRFLAGIANSFMSL